MSLDRRKPLDHAFLEGMRDRIEVARIIDKLNETALALGLCATGQGAMSKMQLEAAKAFAITARVALAKCIPDLKAVEHTDVPPRELTREQLIERLTQLHTGSTRQPERPGTGGTGAVDGATEVQH